MDVVESQLMSLPPEWIDRLFERLWAVYGTKFSDFWKGQELQSVKDMWAREMAGFTAEEIRAGLRAMRRSNPAWPPSLYEFLDLCRPPLDHEAAFYAAVKGCHARRLGEPGQWPNRAVYWAVQDVSPADVLGSTWPQIRARWITALEARLADGNLPPIPEPPKQLTMDKPAGKDAERVRDLATRIAMEQRDARAWVQKILDRKARNDPTLSELAYRMALNSVNIR